MLKKSGLIFKSPVATVSHTRNLGSFIMSIYTLFRKHSAAQSRQIKTE